MHFASLLPLALGLLNVVAAAPAGELNERQWWKSIQWGQFGQPVATTSSKNTYMTTTYASATYAPSTHTSSTSTFTPTSTSTSASSPPDSSTYPSSGSSRNDLVNGICKPVTVIFARGTNEAGNVGLSTGPPFFSALSSAVGAPNIAFQGVDYAASTSGYSGDAAGNAKVASLIALAASQCPGTKIVLSGYSQGCMLMHSGTKSISATQAVMVKAVVLFGDPYNGSPFQGIAAENVDSICHTGDDVCEKGTPNITSAHLNYRDDAAAAANFVKGKVA